MHVPDGILPISYTVTGFAITAAIAGYCLHRVRKRPDPRSDVPSAAMLTTVFFVASLVQIPLPPVSVHLMLSGLMGVVLGWYAFPAILVGLFFQAIMFGHGGLTTLGVNGIILGSPALVAALIYYGLRSRLVSPRLHSVLGFFAGAGAVVASTVLFITIVLTGMPAYLDADLERQAIALLTLAHLPVALIEGLVVASALTFLRHNYPEVITGD